VFIFLTGGSASGKSAWAERIITALRRRDSGPLIYLATMAAEDEESRRRVARHREARAGKGFVTLERPLDLAGLILPPDASLLLEDLGNLCANELYAPGGGREQAVLAGLENIFAQAKHLVVVGNEAAGDGTSWAGLEDYLRALSHAQIACAARSDAAAEVVRGIPVWHKRPKSLSFDKLLKEVSPW